VKTYRPPTRGNSTVSDRLASGPLRVNFNFYASLPFIQDLSLLTHISPSNIEQLQSVGKDAQESRQKFILKDDQEQVWEHVKSFKGRRVDFVLDNGEQCTNLEFACLIYTFCTAGFEVWFLLQI
jgi:Protein of unknown function DUF89.